MRGIHTSFGALCRAGVPLGLSALMGWWGCAAPAQQRGADAAPQPALTAPAIAPTAEAPSGAVAPAAPPPLVGYLAEHDDELSDDDPAAAHEHALGELSEPPAPALGELSDAELKRLLAETPEALGGLSIGAPSAGILVAGERMPDAPEWKLVDPPRAYGTRETIEFLSRAIRKVHAEHPGGHPLYIGHISAKQGGHLSPHKSHQAGRDVDISYYYKQEAEARWYKRATADNLDLPRTWSFVRALISETDVDMILIDHSLQRVLHDYAESIGEDPAWLSDVFRGSPGKRRPLILHAPGHATHIHIRFYNPVAQEAARRLYTVLVAEGRIKPPSQHVSYVARRGDTLVKLAKRFGTSVKAIMHANGLRSTLIRAKTAYKIPKRVGVAAPPKVKIPSRRVPPQREAASRKVAPAEAGVAPKG